MYRSFLLASALASTVLLSAQPIVHQVLVLNEGYYNTASQTQEVPVTLGSYDPATGIYQTVATIPDARFGNHVAVDGEVIYVAADSFLLKYDANTFALLGSTIVRGIRRFAFWGDAMVITRGEIGGLPDYCEVRDKNSLELLYSINNTTLPFSCEGVTVVGDKAYIAENNAFDWTNLTGKIGVLDLATDAWENSIDLGPDGLNPETVMVEGDAVYAFNNKDFSGSSISKMSLGGVLAYTHNITSGSGCGSTAKAGNRVYYMEYAQNVLSRYDLTTDAVLDTLTGSPATYGLIDDPINHVLYGTTTDFFSSGELHVMAYDGQVMSTVPVGVSPGRLALDVRSSTGMQQNAVPMAHLFPNPANDELFVTLPQGAGAITITDASGRAVIGVPATSRAAQRMNVSGLAPGIYTLRAQGVAPVRFCKN